MSLPKEAQNHYDAGLEDSRLTSGSGKIEFLRTLELVLRLAPPPPATVLDVGGGTGVYAFPLAGKGYVVDLLDAVPLHIEQARSKPMASTLRNIGIGDARSLDASDSSYDLVLMLGPLYHLTEASDRTKALQEARRVLKPGGVLVAAAISKYASLFDGFWRGYIRDPDFQSIVRRDLADGQHRNPSHHPAYFTTAKFHSVSELMQEVSSAGFERVASYAIEGFSWLLQDLDSKGREDMQTLLDFLALTESDQDVKAISAHILCVGTKGS